MVIISLELTRVNPDRNIFSINKELTSTFLLYRGLVHDHHQILNYLNICLHSQMSDPFIGNLNSTPLKKLSFLTNSCLLITGVEGGGGVK